MNYDVTTVIWVLVASALIYFMQAGFALCEAGLTRAKNTGNILMKNLMDFCIGTPCYWLVGFGIMFGSTAPIIGRLDPMIRGIYGAENTVVPQTDDRLGIHGGAHELQGLLRVLGGYLSFDLSDRRALGLGRRLAVGAGLSRFCRKCGSSQRGRRDRMSGSMDAGTPHRQV